MIRVLGDRVLVLLPEPEDEITTDSGLVLMRDPDLRKTPTRGIVVQLGQKREIITVDEAINCIGELMSPRGAAVPEHEIYKALRALAPTPFDVAVGNCVIFPLGAGEEFTEAGHDYVVLREDEILGVVQPKENAA